MKNVKRIIVCLVILNSVFIVGKTEEAFENANGSVISIPQPPPPPKPKWLPKESPMTPVQLAGNRSEKRNFQPQLLTMISSKITDMLAKKRKKKIKQSTKKAGIIKQVAPEL